MKRIIVRLVLWCLITLIGSSATLPNVAMAATPPTIIVQETPPPSTSPDFIITSLIGTALPQYIELYNQGSTPLSLHGWHLDITTHDTMVGGCADTQSVINLPEDWILSKRYLTLDFSATANPNSLAIPVSLTPNLLSGCSAAAKISQLQLAQGVGVPELTLVIDPPGTATPKWLTTAGTLNTYQHKQRNNAVSSTRTFTGVFATDYVAATVVNGQVALNSDPPYTPPADVAGLQVVEILPNAKSCSPLETDPTCNDYIKLYNPTDQPIDLALYRLRVGSKGQGESVTNTFTWGKDVDPMNDELILPPQQYFMLTSRNDGQPLTVTDTGNFIWVEDAYGTATYEPVIEYPDASSTTKVGQAWAYNGSAWQWTSTPRPGEANYFPPVVVVPPVPTTTSVAIGDTLKPCAEGQFRNPVTNRCNTIATAAASTLAPCDPGEERNPSTNRCRSIVMATSQLTPCDPGQERNLETNRCRKVAAVAGASTTGTAIKDVAAPSSERTGWIVAIFAVSLALAYGIYEWRQEIQLAGRNAVVTISRLFSRHFRR